MNVLKKILIVEDDQLLNRTLAYNLTSDGYEVISVFNFDSAVRKLRENEFDVALLDINLPDGSGLDLCEEIRNRGQHTYIIFITANDNQRYDADKAIDRRKAQGVFAGHRHTAG